jgi:hypothetical protein
MVQFRDGRGIVRIAVAVNDIQAFAGVRVKEMQAVCGCGPRFQVGPGSRIHTEQKDQRQHKKSQ